MAKNHQGNKVNKNMLRETDRRQWITEEILDLMNEGRNLKKGITEEDEMQKNGYYRKDVKSLMNR